ncbi:nuclease-related domain-containing protein [Sutcliffiella rhizosphaerae]|uniref:NERD domain-containing protein n=1 Tax=Sutcliffiella rhizosphaerae TaxID=2880967 RepID=A0ABM8YJ47_9BACI|nr:nuclease-related domain-containing protein [Sutcliffiella rhizosphaerae]CAG9619954.1 hypothetical protein BACCIP111883_00722 [Sutcliffiella rhizosphaerae]
MIYKDRDEPQALHTLKLLNARMSLTEKDKQDINNLEKGTDGEWMFNTIMGKLTCDCYILNDLLLKMNNNLFQLDSIIITQETIFLNEVKNFEGDFIYELDRFYTLKNKRELSNPLHQLNKNTSLLRQLLQSFGFQLPITSNVIFVNPEFTLYQSPSNIPFIFPTQINRYFNKVNMTPSKLNSKHKTLAETLVSRHHTFSPYNNLPTYDFLLLKKGIMCVGCGILSPTVKIRKCLCSKCGYEEEISNTILRSVKEFAHLFPNEKITTRVIYEWCDKHISRKTIRNTLKKNYRVFGERPWVYYE